MNSANSGDLMTSDAMPPRSSGPSNVVIGHSLVEDGVSSSAIVVVIPTYNEAQNLEAIVAAVLGLGLPNLQVLVVDDNSPDGTGEIADRLALHWNAGPDADARPQVRVLHREGKGGLGTAYIAGMRLALAEGAAYVVQMDADFSHSPDYVPQMLGVMESLNADVVIGSRYVPGGSLDERWSWWRRFVSWWANLYSRAILGLRIRDMTAGFKMWRRAALEAIGLENVKSNGYSFQVEMAYLCERLGFRIVEIPIHFEDRRIGQSKLDIPVKIESAWRTWQIRWQYRALPRRRAELSMAPVSTAPAVAPPPSHVDHPFPGKTS